LGGPHRRDDSSSEDFVFQMLCLERYGNPSFGGHTTTIGKEWSLRTQILPAKIQHHPIKNTEIQSKHRQGGFIIDDAGASPTSSELVWKQKTAGQAPTQILKLP
jgi:hypothetical protein